ncbi:hypothetical protein EV363DRAFT_1427844 [Boletus edulis]|nr:hypothetical protein EV363DRAFT_1427844 [Boletus edulis]
MLYCQRHTELNIPTPVVYAYNCTYGSEFIATEYLDGDTLSHVTKASFRLIGGINPDGSACPLVDGMDGGVGMGLVESFGLYDTDPYESVREYVQAVFDRQFHDLDQILHKSTLLAHEAKFKEEMSCLRYSTPEEIFERVQSKRDGFRAHSYDCEHPFVLRHGDLHGRNVIVSRSSTRHILGMIDWDFGGSHVLPFANDYFELAHPDSDQDTDQRTKQGEKVYRSEFIIDRLIGPPPRVPRLRCLRRYKRLITHPKRHL